MPASRVLSSSFSESDPLRASALRGSALRDVAPRLAGRAAPPAAGASAAAPRFVRAEGAVREAAAAAARCVRSRRVGSATEGQ